MRPFRSTRQSKGSPLQPSRSSRRPSTPTSSSIGTRRSQTPASSRRLPNKSPTKAQTKSTPVTDSRKRKLTPAKPTPTRSSRSRSARQETGSESEGDDEPESPAKKTKKESESTTRGRKSTRSASSSSRTKGKQEPETQNRSPQKEGGSEKSSNETRSSRSKSSKASETENKYVSPTKEEGQRTRRSSKRLSLELTDRAKDKNKDKTEVENDEEPRKRRSLHVEETDNADHDEVQEEISDDDSVIFEGEEFSIESESDIDSDDEAEEVSSDDDNSTGVGVRQAGARDWGRSDHSEELYQRIIQLESEMILMRQKHEDTQRQQAEKLKRLENDLKWKDEQLEEMRTLADKNMELESKLNHLMADPKNYDKEIKDVKEQEEKEKQQKKEAEEKAAETKTDKSGSDESSDSDDSDSSAQEEEEEKPTKKKRKRRNSRKKKQEEKTGPDEIDAYFVDDDDSDSDVQVTGQEGPKTTKSTSDQVEGNKSEKTSNTAENKATESVNDDQNDDTDGESKDDTPHKGRRAIRKLMAATKLQEQTKQAAKAEKDRADRAKKEHDKHLVVTVKDPKTKEPVTKQLVLAFKEGTKTPLVEVNQKLIKKLKPHQVEAVEFMWDNLIESMDKLKENEGSGCLLAHCMGLGKTLSVITLVHTLLCNKAIRMKRCLVVCPLNTVLNWQYEWEKWLDKKDRLNVYELASAKNNHQRADELMTWKKNGGIMIMGYQLFRILVNYSGRSKRVRKCIDESLIDPGPELVVCDEGHILKNDVSSISKSMNRIKTRRRIVLTGTPLQNNLIEYHCMVNFVKPNLLGSRREFGNRFVNPITNGQHSDSTSRDVKLMKRRAHILHSMLDNCVQRRDYSALVKFLPPKYEYVISVRLSKLQIELYEKYLELNRPELNLSTFNGEGSKLKIKGSGLFSDYQNLMRIWTHPWVLKLDEIRQEKKPFTEDDDDELESIIFTSSDEEEEEEILSESSQVTTTSDDDPVNISSESESEQEDEVSLTKSRRTRSGARTDTKDTEVKKDSKGAGRKDTKTDVRKNQGKKDEEGSKRDRRSKRSEKAAHDSDKDRKASSRTNKVVSKKGKENRGAKTNLVDNKPEDESSERRAKLVAGEVIKQWQSTSRGDGKGEGELSRKKPDPWWYSFVNEEHKAMLELSGKLVLMFQILRLAETLGDKVLLFSQSLLSLDLIEDFLAMKNEEAEKKPRSKASRWVKDEDYCRMDGSTGPQNRNKLTNNFNDMKNKRMRLFLISTRAGGLGINLDSANRVIIFDASWNPSHDVQSIFRVYRFGQEKDVYIYRFLAQGTMEEKIYERQVTKETLSQRVIDEHQIDRHFTASDLAELYIFKPDRLDDPDKPSRPTPAVPKDVILAELLTTQKDWIVQYHEHDSLLENRPDEDLNEEERKAAWEEYEREKKGITNFYRAPFAGGLSTTFGGMATAGSLGNTGVPILPTYRLPTYIPPKGPGSIAPGLNLQIAQLPRVVQEILKYNPTISSEDLSKRLQTFLGMHNKYGSFPGQTLGPQGLQTMNISLPGLQLPQNLTSMSGIRVNAPVGQPPIVPGAPVNTLAQTVFMPSRLPQPGNVPANKQ